MNSAKPKKIKLKLKNTTQSRGFPIHFKLFSNVEFLWQGQRWWIFPIFFFQLLLWLCLSQLKGVAYPVAASTLSAYHSDHINEHFKCKYSALIHWLVFHAKVQYCSGTGGFFLILRFVLICSGSDFPLNALGTLNTLLDRASTHTNWSSAVICFNRIMSIYLNQISLLKHATSIWACFSLQ